MELEAKITEITIKPIGEPIFHELATTIKIEDEAAGEFVVISQDSDEYTGKIGITKEEWPLIRDTIEEMIKGCKDNG